MRWLIRGTGFNILFGQNDIITSVDFQEKAASKQIVFLVTVLMGCGGYHLLAQEFCMYFWVHYHQRNAESKCTYTYIKLLQ